MALRELDRFAVDVEPGIYTDGTRVARSPADAWRAVHKSPPTRNKNALPDGWRLELGGHGWWMSKCLKT